VIVDEKIVDRLTQALEGHTSECPPDELCLKCHK
jgi:hypothetical protein